MLNFLLMTFMDWITNANNPKLENYLYGPRHIVVLCLVLISILSIYFIFRNKSDKTKRKLFVTCAWIFVFFEVASRVVNLIITTDYSFANIVKILLPMHFCSITVWVVMIALLTNYKPLINMAPIMGILATGAFLAYPAVGLNLTYISFTAFYSIFSHSLGMVVSVSLLTLKQCNFDIKKIWQPLVIFAIVMAYACILNFVAFPISNYMYITENPLPLQFKIPYQIIYVLVILIYIFLYYIKSLVVTIKANKKAKSLEQK